MFQIKREPALWAALLAIFVQMISAFVLPLTTTQVGAITALAVLVSGALTAWQVTSEKLVPFILGCVQALIALALSFGAVITDGQVSLVMTFVTAVAAIIVRDRVDAPQPAVTGPGVLP